MLHARHTLAALGLVSLCLLALSGCALSGSKLDGLLKDLNYRQLGTVTDMASHDGIDSHSRRVEYAATATYAKLKDRLAELGYRCTETPGPAATATALCQDTTQEITVDLVRGTTGSTLALSIP